MDVLPTGFEFLPLPDGGVLRFALWSPDTAQPRGTILLLGGRAEFIEKYWETIGELTQRGFMVCSFDWRGQGLSSRLLADHRKGHIASFDTYLEDLALIVAHVVKPRMQPPLIVLAHSMGGHLALHFILALVAALTGGILEGPSGFFFAGLVAFAMALVWQQRRELNALGRRVDSLADALKVKIPAIGRSMVGTHP